MKNLFIFYSIFLISFNLSAQTMKAGLWEMKSEMQNTEMNEAMASMQEQLANMPPEQRKQMESMMAKSGVSVGNKGMDVKVCIGKEQASNLKIPNQNQSCKQELIEKKGNFVKFKYTCSNPPSKGESEITFQSDTSFKSKHTVVQGNGEKMEMSQAGKWLGENCGNLKPLPY
jgi:hypothetical protein